MTDTPRIVNGRYHLGDLVLPRVTTILDVMAKPGLERWRHRVGLDEAKRVSETAARLGTRVHAAVEYQNRTQSRGHLEPVDHVELDLAPFVRAYMAWFDQHVEAVVHVEQFVYHARHLYGGTADLVADLRDGRRMLIDIKTSNSLDGSYRLQTAAYAAALEEMGEPVDGRMVVQLPSRRPGELRAVEYDDDERDRLAWAACLRLWRWNERHKEDWKR